MASHKSLKTTFTILALVLALSAQGTQGGVECEKLNKESCAFAVSYLGRRCVLEKSVRRDGGEAYTCRTSEIEADDFLNDMIETDQCVEACGVDREALGISSDALLDSRFAQKLCSTPCYSRCPNIVDLYFNLAAGEGVYLPKLCQVQRQNARRAMAEIKSSGIVAPAPAANHGAIFPAMAPAANQGAIFPAMAPADDQDAIFPAMAPADDQDAIFPAMAPADDQDAIFPAMAPF